MNAKKLLALLLAMSMAGSLCACAGVADDPAADDDKDQEQASVALDDGNSDGQYRFGIDENVEVNPPGCP